MIQFFNYLDCFQIFTITNNIEQSGVIFFLSFALFSEDTFIGVGLYRRLFTFLCLLRLIMSLKTSIWYACFERNPAVKQFEKTIIDCCS